jgi:hypothetical protein
MRPRAALLLLVLVPLALALLPEDGPARLTEQQRVLRAALLDDPGTTATLKAGLREGRLFPDRRSGLVDVTGDGRTDAIVLVTTGGAAGTVALYILSSDGARALRPVLRLQALHRATLRVREGTVTVVEPQWTAGDDLCCPKALRERDYGWRPASSRFVRTAVRDDVLE